MERISIADNTFHVSYAEHIDRYQFAAKWCHGMRVLDAGCGIGYGSAYLANNGAASVVGIDISDTALREANDSFRVRNLSFKHFSVEELDKMDGHFDVVTNFENIEHIKRPELLVSGAAKIADTFITSTPNGAVSAYGPDGKLVNEFHVKEYTVDELLALLKPSFKEIALFGQWITPTGQLRKMRHREAFKALNELYYNPLCRAGRFINLLRGKRSTPPRYDGMDTFEGDYSISPLAAQPFPWEPAVLIAVCKK